MGTFLQRGLENVNIVVPPKGVYAGTVMADLLRPGIDAQHAKGLKFQTMLAVGRQQYPFFDRTLEMYRSGWTAIAEQLFCTQDDWNISPEHPLSLTATARKRLLDPLGVKPEQFIYPTAANIEVYPLMIGARGPLNALLLGIGAEAHFAFANKGARNCLGDPILKAADEPSRVANIGLFDGNLNAVPKEVVTIRFNTLRVAERVYLIMESMNYKDDADRSLYGPITTDVPCSLVRSLPKGKVTIIVGWELAEYLRKKGRTLVETL